MIFSSKSVALLMVLIIGLCSCKSTNEIIYETAQKPSKKIQGRVTDDTSGAPVKGAKVWVEGTTIYDETNASGDFNLSVPAGYYEIDANKEGYASNSEEVFLSEYSTASGNVNLKMKKDATSYPATQNNSEVRSESLEKDASKNLQRFIDHYINDDLNCELVNKNEIVFAETNEKGLMRINRPVQLAIKNYELGYEVKVNLREYASKSYGDILGMDVDADYFFEKMEPSSPGQAKDWEEKRNEYFRGSLRHFLISMASKKSPLFFGYRMYSGTFVQNTSAMAYSESRVSDIEVGKDGFLTTGSRNETLALEFDGELRIEYLERGVDDPDNIMGLDSYDNQTSWLSLNIDEVEFTRNGTLENPDLIQVKGVWRYTPVCKMLPNDYLPEK